VKDKYQRYKTLTNKVKDQEAQLETLRGAAAEPTAQLQAVREQISKLEALLSRSSTSAAADNVRGASVKVAPGVVMGPPKDLRDAEMQTEDARSNLLRRANTQKGLDDAAAGNASPRSNLSADAQRIAELTQALEAESLTVEQLDDQLYQLRQDFEKLQTERDKIETERAFLGNQVGSSLMHIELIFHEVRTLC
jgi:uncharacterized coiled-coil protein SlyX